MNQIGKVGKEWLKVRKQWVKLNPPNHEGYYVCAIGGDWVLAEYLELDHIIARSRRPDLRFELSNLQPSCSKHNSEKGSKS